MKLGCSIGTSTDGRYSVTCETYHQSYLEAVGAFKRSVLWPMLIFNDRLENTGFLFWSKSFRK